jgi:hypothetical protein
MHHDAGGGPDKFEAKVNYRDFDGRTRQVAAWAEAANSLRSVLKERVKKG